MVVCSVAAKIFWISLGFGCMPVERTSKILNLLPLHALLKLASAQDSVKAFTSSTWHAPAIFFSLQFFRSSFTYPSLPKPVDLPAKHKCTETLLPAGEYS
jgi:hypothetical protein